MADDMNACQIANLTSEQVAKFNGVFRGHRELLRDFGDDLLLEPAA